MAGSALGGGSEGAGRDVDGAGWDSVRVRAGAERNVYRGTGRGQAGKPSAQHSWLALDLHNCSPFPPGGVRREATTSKRKLSA